MKAEDRLLDEGLSDVADILRDVREFVSDLECAETVETLPDFRANIAEACARLFGITNALRALKRKVGGK